MLVDNFQKRKKKYKINKETGYSRYIYQSDPDKTCFQHDMAFGNFENRNRKTVSDEILRYKAFNIAKNTKYDGYQRGLASMVYKCFDKKTSGGAIKNDILSYRELAKQLHKPIISKFKKRKVYSSFIDNF